MALKVLSALDTASTQYYHFKAIIIAGMGMFTDAYDLFCIPPIMTLIGRVHYEHVKEEKDKYMVPPEIVSAMFGIALLGAVIGNILFGRLGDRTGRKRMYGFALVLMVVSSIGCGFSLCSSRPCVLVSLAFFRFLLGIGIGGDYPLSATIMSEFANKRTRGSFIAAVFSMQGFGILMSSTVTIIVCAIFNRASHPQNNATPHAADLVWRVILMIGAIPAGLTLYWRLMMPETARYTALVERNVIKAAKNMEKVLEVSLSQIMEDEASPQPNPPSYPLLSQEFLRRHGRDLFSCSTSWFLVDFVFYSSNLFQSLIYNNYLPLKEELNAYEAALEVAKLQAIIAICSTIPGYFATVYFIDRIGRVKIQIMGFFFMALGLFAIGIPYSIYWDDNPNIGFMFLYGLTFFFSNFGPNTTTFIVPAELFPARFRTTCHGIAGASGKVGAIFGLIGFLWASPESGIGMTASLVILGGVCILGGVTTYLFTFETKWRSLEENEKEDETDGLIFVRGFRTSCIRARVPVNEVAAV